MFPMYLFVVVTACALEKYIELMGEKGNSVDGDVQAIHCLDVVAKWQMSKQEIACTKNVFNVLVIFVAAFVFVVVVVTVRINCYWKR